MRVRREDGERSRNGDDDRMAVVCDTRECDSGLEIERMKIWGGNSTQVV